MEDDAIIETDRLRLRRWVENDMSDFSGFVAMLKSCAGSVIVQLDQEKNAPEASMQLKNFGIRMDMDCLLALRHY